MKTLYLFLLVAFTSSNIFAQLSGVYTIDNSLPTKKKNFNSFAEVVNEIKSKGVSGDVVFNVAPSTYYELIVLEGVIDEFTNASITFKSSSDAQRVKVVNDALALMVVNSRNITFENFDFESRTASYSSVINFDNAINVNISNSRIATTSVSNNDRALIALANNSEQNKFDSNELNGNKIVSVAKFCHNNTFANNDMKFKAEIAVDNNSNKDLNMMANIMNGVADLVETASVVE
jgi:hypothetical protein